MMTLENLEEFSVDLQEHPLKWMFEDENNHISNEVKDQVFALLPNAAKFLWNCEAQFNIFGKEFHEHIFFNDNEEFFSGRATEQEIKKWLYNRGIAFDQRVYLSIQPEWGFVLTWKMVIRFSYNLFWGHDRALWDKTLNWGLYFDHNDHFHFGKNRRFTASDRSEQILENNRIIQEALKQAELNKTIGQKKYSENPYLKRTK